MKTEALWQGEAGALGMAGGESSMRGLACPPYGQGGSREGACLPASWDRACRVGRQHPGCLPNLGDTATASLSPSCLQRPYACLGRQEDMGWRARRTQPWQAAA